MLRRWTRYRAIARALDGALVLAAHVPANARVLDVGCGRGFLAHHLAALGRSVTGVDLTAETDAPIAYQRFDGVRLPFPERSFDVVLFSFVLHHAPNVAGLITEGRRVLQAGGRIVVYEDIPERWHDRLLCWWHERKWGACTFLGESTWKDLFGSLGLRVRVHEALPRLRNPTHPVRGALFVLELA